MSFFFKFNAKITIEASEQTQKEALKDALKAIKDAGVCETDVDVGLPSNGQVVLSFYDWDDAINSVHALHEFKSPDSSTITRAVAPKGLQSWPDMIEAALAVAPQVEPESETSSTLEELEKENKKLKFRLHQTKTLYNTSYGKLGGKSFKPETEPTLVYVTMEGGVVQDVSKVGSESINVMIVDYDTEGAEDSEMMLNSEDTECIVTNWFDVGEIMKPKIFRTFVPPAPKTREELIVLNHHLDCWDDTLNFYEIVNAVESFKLGKIGCRLMFRGVRGDILANAMRDLLKSITVEDERV